MVDFMSYTISTSIPSLLFFSLSLRSGDIHLSGGPVIIHAHIMITANWRSCILWKVTTWPLEVAPVVVLPIDYLSIDHVGRIIVRPNYVASWIFGVSNSGSGIQLVTSFCLSCLFYHIISNASL